MRACLIAHRFYDENSHMMQFANALARRGDKVDVISVRRIGLPKSEIIDGVQVRRLQTRTVDETRPMSHLLKTLVFLIRTACIVMVRHLRDPYDVIHVQSVPDFLVFAALLPKLFGTKVILDLRDLVPELYASKFNVRRDSAVYKLLCGIEKVSTMVADHVIVANPIWYERVVNRSAKRAKCSMFWYYPDPILFSPRPKRRNDGKFVITYPGTLNWHQGVDIAVRAFPRVLEKLPNAEFHIYGEGPAKGHLKALIRDLGLAERVRLFDPLPLKQIVEVMAESDLGVVPKRVSRGFGDEAASTKIPEFLALGVPVVASTTKVERCFFDDSMVRYVTPEDEEELAAAVVAVSHEPILTQQLIANGTRSIQQTSWEAAMAEYRALVDALVASVNKPAEHDVSGATQESVREPAVVNRPQPLTDRVFENTHYCKNLPVASRNTRKRVCMLVYAEYDSDNRVRRYAETLARRGDYVEVVALRNGGPSEHELNGVHVFSLQHRRKDERWKWQYAFRVLCFFIGSSAFLVRRHRQIRYDLVHVHNMPDVLVFAAWYPKWSGAKIIIDIHDLVPELFCDKFGSGAGDLYARVLRGAERASAAFSDHVIISNHLWYNTVTTRSVPPQKCSVFLNHIDPVLFSRCNRSRKDGKLVMLFPGSFQRHQGLDIAIQAVALARLRLPNAELHLYGSGPNERELRALAERLGLNGTVKFCGTARLDDIPRIMADADLGIVPKRADSFGDEAYSTKIMEFMSQGVPVIVSRTKVDAYYFDDRLVRFFPSGDAQALAHAMVELATRPDLRDTLIANGREYAERNSWENRKQEYLDLVDSLTTRSF